MIPQNTLNVFSYISIYIISKMYIIIIVPIFLYMHISDKKPVFFTF